MRVSDADREGVAEILREAAATGRITIDELHERLDAAFQARTYDDLAPLTADLPSEEAPAAGPSVPVASRGDVEAADRPLVLESTWGEVIRKGQWTVPGTIEVANPMGSTVLDFRNARLLSRTVDVDLSTSWGETRIVLPDGATADVRVNSSWFGAVDSRVPSAPVPDAPHFIVHGEVKGGSLKVRYRLRIDEMFGLHG